jgi:hypothetical protein
MTDKLLRDYEVKKLGGRGTKVLLYPELNKYKDIDHLFDEHGNKIALLYINEQDDNSTTGHWVGLLRNKRGKKMHYEIFDSYGKMPDEHFDEFPDRLRKQLRQGVNKLTRLMYKRLKGNEGDTVIEFNEIPYQRTDPRIATCGRWCGLRLRHGKIPLDQFQKIISDSKRPYDELVVDMSDSLLGKAVGGRLDPKDRPCRNPATGKPWTSKEWEEEKIGRKYQKTPGNITKTPSGTFYKDVKQDRVLPWKEGKGKVSQKGYSCCTYPDGKVDARYCGKKTDTRFLDVLTKVPGVGSVAKGIKQLAFDEPGVEMPKPGSIANPLTWMTSGLAVANIAKKAMGSGQGIKGGRYLLVDRIRDRIEELEEQKEELEDLINAQPGDPNLAHYHQLLYAVEHQLQVLENELVALQNQGAGMGNEGGYISRKRIKIMKARPKTDEQLLVPLPNYIKDFIKTNGDVPIAYIEVCREPVMAAIETAANLITLGKYNKDKLDRDFDKMFHLFMVIGLENGKRFVYEKNQKITLFPTGKDFSKGSSKGAECRPVTGVAAKNVTFGDMVLKAIKKVGIHQYSDYDIINRNCQRFVADNLAAVGLLSPTLKSFIEQDVTDLIPKYAQAGSRGFISIAAALTEMGHKIFGKKVPDILDTKKDKLEGKQIDHPILEKRKQQQLAKEEDDDEDDEMPEPSAPIDGTGMKRSKDRDMSTAVKLGRKVAPGWAYLTDSIYDLAKGKTSGAPDQATLDRQAADYRRRLKKQRAEYDESLKKQSTEPYILEGSRTHPILKVNPFYKGPLVTKQYWMDYNKIPQWQRDAIARTEAANKKAYGRGITPEMYYAMITGKGSIRRGCGVRKLGTEQQEREIVINGIHYWRSVLARLERDTLVLATQLAVETGIRKISGDPDTVDRLTKQLEKLRSLKDQASLNITDLTNRLNNMPPPPPPPPNEGAPV